MGKLNPAHKPHHEKILFFAIAKKAQISSVTTQVDQNFAFFATLILNLPALIVSVSTRTHAGGSGA